MKHHIVIFLCVALAFISAYSLCRGFSNIVEGMKGLDKKAAHPKTAIPKGKVHASQPTDTKTASNDTAQKTLPVSSSAWTNSLAPGPNCTFAACNGVPVTEFGNCHLCGDDVTENVKDCPPKSKLCPGIPKHMETGQCVPTGVSFTPENACIVSSTPYDPNHPYVKSGSTTWTRCEYAEKNMSSQSDCSVNFSRPGGKQSEASMPSGTDVDWDNRFYTDPHYDESYTIEHTHDHTHGRRGHGHHRDGQGYRHHRHPEGSDGTMGDHSQGRGGSQEKEKGRKSHGGRDESTTPGPYKCRCKPQGYQNTKGLASNSNHKPKHTAEIDCNCTPEHKPRKPHRRKSSDEGSDADTDDDSDADCSDDETSVAWHSKTWPTRSSVTGLFTETGIPPAESYFLVSPPQ